MINTKQQTMRKLENNVFSLGTKQFETKTDNGTVLIKISVTQLQQYLIFLGLIIAISFTLKMKRKNKAIVVISLISGFIFMQGSIRNSARA